MNYMQCSYLIINVFKAFVHELHYQIYLDAECSTGVNMTSGLSQQIWIESASYTSPLPRQCYLGALEVISTCCHMGNSKQQASFCATSTNEEAVVATVACRSYKYIDIYRERAGKFITVHKPSCRLKAPHSPPSFQTDGAGIFLQ